MALDLLPKNATAFERNLSKTLDRTASYGPTIESIAGFKTLDILPETFGPWMVAEFGLGPISEFFNDADMLIGAGIPWQRLRGTPLALAIALSWLEYIDLTLEDANERRLKWNRYQIDMGRVPESERPILLKAEYLAGLSDPARSVFFRGFHGYDVRALEWSGRAWGNSIWGDDSGVRLPDGSVKWSHGEILSGTIIVGEEERQALGVNVSAGDEPGWEDVPWDAPGMTWGSIDDVSAFRSYLVRRMPVLVGFYDEDGDAIGFRRPIAVRDAPPTNYSGEKSFIEVECRTGFGDGGELEAKHVSLVFRAGHPSLPGKLWIEPDDLEFEDGFDPVDMTIGNVPVDFTFRRTVRQHVTLTLEI